MEPTNPGEEIVPIQQTPATPAPQAPPQAAAGQSTQSTAPGQIAELAGQIIVPLPVATDSLQSAPAAQPLPVDPEADGSSFSVVASPVIRSGSSEPEISALDSRPQSLAQDATPDSHVPLQWTSGEPAAVAAHKAPMWFAAVAAGGLVLGAGSFLLTKDVISSVVVVAAVFGLLFLALHKPAAQQYALAGGALQVGPKRYDLAMFRSFSAQPDGNHTYISLTPLRRYFPAITVYVGAEQEDAVVAALSDYLPLENHKPDAIDSLMRRLRF